MPSRYDEPVRENRIYREMTKWPPPDEYINDIDLEEFVEKFMDRRVKRFLKD